MNEFEKVAVRAAKEAGNILKANLGKIQKVSGKDRKELTTNTDLESERKIVSIISSSFPNHGILGEEQGLQGNTSEYLWIVDPLDGTTNYIHQYPNFCVSIALAWNREVILGVVYNPSLDELFIARKGGGALLNGSSISVSRQSVVADSFLTTGFPYNLSLSDSDNTHIKTFVRFMQIANGKIRRGGSSVLDLCYVAAGRFDGYWHPELSLWDIAAAGLLLKESGGDITDYSGRPLYLLDGKTQVLASNALLHSELQSIVNNESGYQQLIVENLMNSEQVEVFWERQEKSQQNRNRLTRGKRKVVVSEQYWQRAQKVILDGTLLYSKAPSVHVQGVSPIYLQRGKGAYSEDVDGNRYIDYSMGLGSILLGYCYPRVSEAIQKQLTKGTIFSLAHPLEVECAELLVNTIPCAEMVRFFKTGSSAMSAAIRIARAYTGREKVINGRYHGWHDWTIAGTKRCAGIPNALKNTVFYAPYNDIDGFERLFAEHKGEIAAVAIEPVLLEEPRNDFLSKLQSLTRQENALLIFDEIVTGFRFAIGGAQECFQIIPDLATFGKGMANGMPLAAVVGKADIMSQVSSSIFMSSTFAGETLSLAAYMATIQEIKEKGVITHIWGLGQRLKQETNQLARNTGMANHIECVGLPPRMNLVYRDTTGADWIELKTLFLQEVVKRGVFLGWNIFISFSHTQEDIDYTLEVFQEVMLICKDALKKGNVIERLEGRLARSVSIEKIQ